jgi:hypothetical protein
VIARVWTGVVAREHRDRYVAYVDSTGVDAYRHSPGCRLATILTRDLDDGRAEVTAFSIWDDEVALRRFAGDDITAMVLYPEDRAYLLEEPQLRHHQVAGPGLSYPSGENS